MRYTDKRRRHVVQDLLIVGASVVLAVAIVRYGLVQQLLAQTGDSVIAATFIAGIFFTSIATTAPAIAVLGELSLHGNLWLTAILGGLGAIIGDSLLFLFVRDRVSDDIGYLLSRTGTPRYIKLFKRHTFRWVLPFVGGLIIASPLPDELGLALLGMSKMSTTRFMLLSFAFNATGILLIGLAARALAS
jgi:hypothetical protein